MSNVISTVVLYFKRPSFPDLLLWDLVQFVMQGWIRTTLLPQEKIDNLMTWGISVFLIDHNMILLIDCLLIANAHDMGRACAMGQAQANVRGPQGRTGSAEGPGG